MKMITKEEECLGKYATKRKAQQMAKAETLQTGCEHHVFLTHYFCPHEWKDKMCWTILLSPVKKGITNRVTRRRTGTLEI